MYVYEKVRAYIDDHGLKQIVIAKKGRDSQNNIQCNYEW